MSSFTARIAYSHTVPVSAKNTTFLTRVWRYLVDSHVRKLWHSIAIKPHANHISKLESLTI